MPYEVVAFCFYCQSFKFTNLFSLQFYTIGDILVSKFSKIGFVFENFLFYVERMQGFFKNIKF